MPLHLLQIGREPGAGIMAGEEYERLEKLMFRGMDPGPTCASRSTSRQAFTKSFPAIHESVARERNSRTSSIHEGFIEEGIVAVTMAAKCFSIAEDLANQHGVCVDAVSAVGEFAPPIVVPEDVRFRNVPKRIPENMLSRIQAESVDSAVEPVPGDRFDLLEHFRFSKIQVGHGGAEKTEIPDLLAAATGRDMPGSWRRRLIGSAEMIELAKPRVWILHGLLEPGMLRRM